LLSSNQPADEIDCYRLLPCRPTDRELMFYFRLTDNDKPLRPVTCPAFIFWRSSRMQTSDDQPLRTSMRVCVRACVRACTLAPPSTATLLSLLLLQLQPL
jgi:hypothetical protein